MIRGSRLVRRLIGVAGLASAMFALPVLGQGPVTAEFTYQGKLTDAGVPVTNAVDFRFTLFDSPSGGAQVGSTLLLNNTTPISGLVTVGLDFGFSAFMGQQRYVEIEVRNPAGIGLYSVLTPRQRVAATPYALYALNGNAGPQGPIGPQGLPGTAGAPGAQGPAGMNGNDGAPGAPGAQGPAGLNGNDGAAGAAGAPGTNGTNGTNGTDGTNGTNANVKVFYFNNQLSSAWTGTIVGTDSSTSWSLSLSNSAFTQGAKDSALVAVFKKGSDNASMNLPIYNGMKQESFVLPSGNTNIDLNVKRMDNLAFERPETANYRIVLAYPSFVKTHPEIDWNSERSVLAALKPRSGN